MDGKAVTQWIWERLWILLVAATILHVFVIVKLIILRRHEADRRFEGLRQRWTMLSVSRGLPLA
jgi:hypothetical protein